MNNKYSIALSSEKNIPDNYYITFIIRNRKYAVNIRNVTEVINMPKIEFSQRTPKGIIGIFNYNGNYIKVVDLCPFQGLDEPEFSINNQLIIVYSGSEYFALYTEKILNILSCENSEIQSVPYEMDDLIVSGLLKIGGDTIGIIETTKLNSVLKKSSGEESKVNYFKLFPNDEKSLQVLNLRTCSLSKNRQEFSFPVDEELVRQYVLFTLSGQNYFLDLKYVKEFVSIRRLNITKLPYTKDFIKGLINVKGNFLVAVDLNRFFKNEKNTISEGSKLIVVQGKNYDLAFLVDEIKYIKNLKNIPRNLNNAPISEYISAEFTEENILYSIINFEKIINDEQIYINID